LYKYTNINITFIEQYTYNIIINKMFISNKLLFYNEFNKNEFNKNELDIIWDNNNIIKSYIFLINNINNNITNKKILTEREFNFYISKLLWLRNILYSSNIEKKYKNVLLNNIRIDLQYLGIKY
jgi:hypothetical protein